MQPETKFKIKVLRDLRALPVTWAEKIQQVGIRGTPDILACINGLFVAIELKRNAECDADPLQLFTLGEIKIARGKALVASPENWPTVYAYLKSIAAA